MVRRRDQLIAQGKSFTTETVFSHESKLQLVAADYEVLLEVVAVPVETSIERVAQRVAEGGHDVPEDKIRHRAVRADRLIPKAIPLANQARIWQNAEHQADLGTKLGHERIARFEHGVLVVERRTPEWVGPGLRRAIADAPRLGRPDPVPPSPSPRPAGLRPLRGFRADTPRRNRPPAGPSEGLRP